MTSKYAAIIAASLMTLAAVQAKSRSTTDMARENLRDVEDSARMIAVEADTLETITRDPQQLSTATLSDLETVRERINSVGKELRALDGERDALLPWERRTLDQVVPLFADAARTETQAIEYYNANRMRPVGTEFRGYIERLHNDADQAARLIAEHLKLERAKDRQARMGHLLNEEGN